MKIEAFATRIKITQMHTEMILSYLLWDNLSHMEVNYYMFPFSKVCWPKNGHLVESQTVGHTFS